MLYDFYTFRSVAVKQVSYTLESDSVVVRTLSIAVRRNFTYMYNIVLYAQSVC